MKILVKSAKIIDPKGEFHNQIKDILIDKGNIVKIGKNILADGAKEIASKNLHVSPGWFDFRFRVGVPGMEVKEDMKSAVEAAMHGGFTGGVAIPSANQFPDNPSVINDVKNSDYSSLFDLLVSGNVSVNAAGKELSEMKTMADIGVRVFQDDKKGLNDASFMTKLLQYSSSIDDILISVFPDNAQLSQNFSVGEGHASINTGLRGIPAISESIAVSRDVKILEYLEKGKLHFNSISTIEGIKEINISKSNKHKVSADVNIFNLIANEEEYVNFDSNFKVLPPLRSEGVRKKLIQAIENKVIDVICSDHTPSILENKFKEFEYADFGISSLDYFYPMYQTFASDILGIETFISAVTYGPKGLLNLKIDKVQDGETANLTLFDPSLTQTASKKNFYSKAHNFPFLEKELKGMVVGVINNKKANLYI